MQYPTAITLHTRKPILAPIERLSEILFGLIMVLTFTGSLSVSTADHSEVHNMLLGAIGCNVAWGLIDAVMYLMAAMTERAGEHRAVMAVREAKSSAAAHDAIRNYLPPVVANALREEEIENIRSAISNLDKTPIRPHLKRDDWRGAIGVFVLVFFSTLPVVLPFVFMTEANVAMRVSNAIAITMLAFIGYAYGQLSFRRPLVMSGAMVALGAILVSITIALGG